MTTTDMEPRKGFLNATRSFFDRNSASHNANEADIEEAKEIETDGEMGRPTTKWSLGIMNVPTTHEVPGKDDPLSEYVEILLIAIFQAPSCCCLIIVIILWDFGMYQQ